MRRDVALVCVLTLAVLAQERFPNDPGWREQDWWCDISWPDLLSCERPWAQKMIRLPHAWVITTGDPTVKIAIVDTSFDPLHEDLVERVNARASGLEGNDVSFGRHGTEVASMAAAVGNNGKGLAGVMWQAELQLYSCGKGTGESENDTEKCWDMVQRAILNEARIIGVSFGTNFHEGCRMGNKDRQAKDSVEKAWRSLIEDGNKRPGGVLFVFAAGNDSTPFDDFLPAGLSRWYPNVISVGAVDREKNRASYSNYGALDIWAPGGDLIGSRENCGRIPEPRDWRALSPPPFWQAAKIWVAQPKDDYGYATGTSLAAPFVAGVAGLMFSANPHLTASQLKQMILRNAVGTGENDPSDRPIRILDTFGCVLDATVGYITSPVQGSRLPSSRVAFTWTGGSGVTEYWLQVGSSAGARDVYDASQGTALSATVTGIPAGDRQIYVRLYSYVKPLEAWYWRDYVYQAPLAPTAAPAEIISPPNGSVLGSSSAVFSWSAGSRVSRYILWVGSAQGGKDIYEGDQGRTLSATVTGLPTDGRTVYVRLWSYIDDIWHYNDYTYKAHTATRTAGRAYVNNHRSNSVSVIDTGTDAVVSTIQVGAGPGPIRLAPDGTKAYVGNFRSNTVTVIDAARDRVTSTIETGPGPCNIVFAPGGGKAYVTNYNGGSLLSNLAS